MLPHQAEPPALLAPDPAARAEAALHGAGGDWKALRAELRTALAGAERQSGRSHPRTLTLRALAGLVLDRQGEARGLRMYAEACGELHRQLRRLQRTHGPEGAPAIPYLEALRDLYRLEKLPEDPWEDPALRARVRTSQGPRPDLEGRALAALERHYGGFLSFRPPDRAEVLEDAALLLNLWSRREDATRAFLETGLRGDARGVWRLVAVHGGEALRTSVRSLLEGLDPKVLAAQPGALQAWLPGQASTPWSGQARTLAERVSESLGGTGLAPVEVLRWRVRLADAVGEKDRAAALVSEALRDSSLDRPRVLALAEERVRATGDPGLIRALHAALHQDQTPADGEVRGLRAADARRLEALGDLGAAEVAWRGLLGGGGGPDPEALHRALGANLAAQGRHEEARFFLEPLTAAGPGATDPSLRFLLAAVEQGRGDGEAARCRAREGFALLPAEGPLPQAAGLAAALRLLRADPEAPFLDLAARLRKRLDPEGRVPALEVPETLLGLAEALERPPAPRPGSACASPWTELGEGPGERGMALFQAAEGRPLAEAEPCLREALRDLERAWGAEDPRLLEPLLRLAQCLEDQEHPDAEGLLRRALALATAARLPRQGAEAAGRLAQVLAARGQVDEADTLLAAALPRLLAVTDLDPKALEALGGLLLLRLAALEHRGEPALALEALEQVATRLEGLEGDPRKELDKFLGELQPRLRRQAQVLDLLRAQGLP